jgi:hypothetical protein
MKAINKIVIEKLHFSIDNRYNFNLCVLTSIDGGKNYCYCGIGNYATDDADVLKKLDELKKRYNTEIVEDWR